MKHSTAVALIVEAHRQGHAEADSSYRSLLEKVNHSATIEALQAEVERLKAEVRGLLGDALLGRLVKAMPEKWTLLHCVGYWSAHGEVEHGANGDTPTLALVAAGVGQEEEPDAKT